MNKGRRTSVVVLITLAELAWLAAFGLLFAYRGKVGELGRMRHDLSGTSNLLARWQASAPEVGKLLVEVDAAKAARQRLQEDLAVFNKLLAGAPPEEAARRLAAAEVAEKRLAEADEQSKQLRSRLEEKDKAAAAAVAAQRMAEEEVAKLREELAALTPGVETLGEHLRSATNQLAKAQRDLEQAQVEKNRMLEEGRHREIGEFSVRRELTGLPDGDLRRVIFLVDTSTSMKRSPAWDSARKLISTWLEFLPVEECVLVNFNDRAVGFPSQGYFRLRDENGRELAGKREELLGVFHRARAGNYTDLLRGLRCAYGYPRADVMVIFTDGHPEVPYESDADLVREIFKEVKDHPGVPILTVALGSYEIEGIGLKPRVNAAVSFLKELGRRSGGSFLGR
jgi:hypothetical protein